MPLSDNIKKLRLLRNLSVKKLAEMMKVDRQNIYNWERGDFEPTAENLDKLSEILNVPKKAFFEEEGTSVVEADNELEREHREMQRKYIKHLERGIEIRDMVISSLKQRLKDAGLDASVPEY